MSSFWRVTPFSLYHGRYRSFRSENFSTHWRMSPYIKRVSFFLFNPMAELYTIKCVHDFLCATRYIKNFTNYKGRYRLATFGRQKSPTLITHKNHPQRWACSTRPSWTCSSLATMSTATNRRQCRKSTTLSVVDFRLCYWRVKMWRT